MSADRPEPVAKPPLEPKWGAIGCVLFVMTAVYFAMLIGANLAAVVLAHRWGIQ